MLVHYRSKSCPNVILYTDLQTCGNINIFTHTRCGASLNIPMSPRRPIDQEQLIFQFLDSPFWNWQCRRDIEPARPKNSLGAGPLKYPVPVFLSSNLHLLRQVRLGRKCSTKGTWSIDISNSCSLSLLCAWGRLRTIGCRAQIPRKKERKKPYVKNRREGRVEGEGQEKMRRYRFE